MNVPLRIIDSAAGLWGVDATINYDAVSLELLNGFNGSDVQLAGMFASESDWIIDSYVDQATGTAKLSIYRSLHRRLPVVL